MSAMKLSDMIDRGCSRIPKQAHNAFVVERRGEISAACAMFTACYWHQPARAVNNRYEPYLLYDELDKFLKEHHGAGLYTEIAHPVSGDAVCVGTLVEELNDHYRWPREKIAGWLRERGL